MHTLFVKKISFLNELNIDVKTKETREMLRYKDKSKLIKTYVVSQCKNLKSARRLTVILPKLANYVLKEAFNIQLVKDLIINIKSNLNTIFTYMNYKS